MLRGVASRGKHEGNASVKYSGSGADQIPSWEIRIQASEGRVVNSPVTHLPLTLKAMLKSKAQSE